jgi:Yip1 domain
MTSFWRYFIGTIIKPRPTFRKLLADPKHVSKSFKAVLFMGILYTITVVCFAASGALISAPAFINLSPENYYFWEMFFAAPVFFLGWILAAGFAQLLSRGGKGAGTFEGTLATLGFAVSVPQLVTWIPETIFVIFLLLGMKQEEFMERAAQPGFWQTFVIAYQAVAVIWMLILAITAIIVSQKMRWWRSLLIGLLTIAVFMAVMLVFIR